MKWQLKFWDFLFIILRNGRISIRLSIRVGRWKETPISKRGKVTKVGKLA